MRESVIYQEIEAAGIEKGVRQGVHQGVQQEAVSFTLRLLKRRLGEVKPELQTRIQGLGVEQLEELGEALIDFKHEEELVNWLEVH
jgi:predicted transposase YdaD